MIMATVNSIKNQIVNKEAGQQVQTVDAKQLDLKTLLATPTLKSKFDEVLKERAPQFISSVLNLVNNDKVLKNADPMSVVTSVMVAATLDLPVDKNLGYAWVVPFRDKHAGGVQKAQFQLGYKGYIQLALRTGQYKHINAIPVRKGELVEWNPLTEEFKIDFTKTESDEIIGYAGYFELLNGFKKTVYWTKQQIELHKKKYSKTEFGWKIDYDAMALKTVLRQLLSKWGILSVEMQRAYTSDEREVKEVHVQDGVIDIAYEDVLEGGTIE